MRKKYKDAPNLWQLSDLVRKAFEGPSAARLLGGPYYPARPCGLDTLSSRVRIAWLVFTGRADAVIWDEKPVPDLRRPSNRETGR